MIRRSPRGAALAAAVLLLTLPGIAAAATTGGTAPDAVTTVGDARLEPLRFSDLPGWAADDHAVALATFRRTCAAIRADGKVRRPPGRTGADLLRACAQARRVAPGHARTFFERHFAPHLVVPAGKEASDPGSGFLTGYFEPVYEGSLRPGPDYPAPLLAPPANLVAIPAGASLPGIDPELRAARKTSRGYEPVPDRAAIEEGALGDDARPLVWLRHPAEAFIIHVQGSARIRLPDGRSVRVAFAGRNGQPYTSIGRILVQEGTIPLEEMNLERLVSWLKDNPERGRELMRRNRSYIFFRIPHELKDASGPVGGSGIPLTAGRSLAVDQNLWGYGLPFWLDGTLPTVAGGTEPLRRLLVAQDTGAAITGPARGDLYVGSGARAGTLAGMIRHRIRFVVLLPRAESRP